MDRTLLLPLGTSDEEIIARLETQAATITKLRTEQEKRDLIIARLRKEIAKNEEAAGTAAGKENGNGD